MKKYLLILPILFFISGAVLAQTVVFWTDQSRTGPIKIYMNGKYCGTITKRYTSTPDCYASGCVTVTPPNKHNPWEAIANDGSRWSGDVKLSSGCNTLRLQDVNPPPRKQTSSNSNSSPTNTTTGGGGEALAGLGLALAGLAVVAGEVILNSDLYVSGIASDYYSGLEFGFRNNWNSHISFEQTVVWRYGLNKPLFPPFHTDTYGYNPFWEDYNYRSRSNWGCNFRMIYNFLDRDRIFGRNKPFMINPYVGFGCDYMQYDGFFTSGVVGFTFGSRRVKMDCRYTFGYDFRYQRIPVNQLQIGLIVAYQYRKFGFFKH